MSTDFRRVTDLDGGWFRGSREIEPEVALDLSSDAQLPFDLSDTVIDLRERLFTNDGARRLAERAPRTHDDSTRHRHHHSWRRLSVRRLISSFPH